METKMDAHTVPLGIPDSLTRRDYFAIAALPAVVTAYWRGENRLSERDLEKIFPGRVNVRNQEIIAAIAYLIADEMLVRSEIE